MIISTLKKIKWVRVMPCKGGGTAVLRDGYHRQLVFESRPEECARGKVVGTERGEVAKGQIAQGVIDHAEDLAVDE